MGIKKGAALKKGSSARRERQQREAAKRAAEEAAVQQAAEEAAAQQASDEAAVAQKAQQAADEAAVAAQQAAQQEQATNEAAEAAAQKAQQAADEAAVAAQQAVEEAAQEEQAKNEAAQAAAQKAAAQKAAEAKKISSTLTQEQALRLPPIVQFYDNGDVAPGVSPHTPVLHVFHSVSLFVEMCCRQVYGLFCEAGAALHTPTEGPLVTGIPFSFCLITGALLPSLHHCLTRRHQCEERVGVGAASIDNSQSERHKYVTD